MPDRKAPQGKSKQAGPASEAWNKLPWRKLEQHVFRIQKRIYRASQRGNTRAVQKLQKLLTKSEAARLLAVRRVTQDNQGKKTAGIDGIKSVKPTQRLVMAHLVHPKHWKRSKARPVRRVWIPKPGKDEKRPLGIPTMLDRAKQALVKAALEAEWEAKFEPNSYGFRPGRSCHDAIQEIYITINHKPKFVFDADIKGCFDNIDQEALLRKLQAYPAMKHTIKGWLKAGVLEGDVFAPTEAGTPQGGVISPLLANIALHGLETAIRKGYGTARSSEKPTVVRYADDFVVLHSKREAIEQAAKGAEEWLQGMGLYLNAKKTRITHTLTPVDGNVGFDFLGFSIKQHPVGKTHTGKVGNQWKSKPLGFKTHIKPSKEAVKRHMREIKLHLRKVTNSTQAGLIKDLNPKIQGWANYYKAAVSSQVFKACDHILYHQLGRWAQKKHPTRGKRWIQRKYWRTVGQNHWVFATPAGARIREHSMTEIHRFVKVKGATSPYDGNLLYWSKRLRAHPMVSGTLGKLLQLQKGRCRRCGLLFREGDTLEIDHILPTAIGGSNRIENKCVLHRHCHDEKTAEQSATVRALKAAGITF